MTPRTITESYEGGTISVGITEPTDHSGFPGEPYVRINAFELGDNAPSLLYLTRDESDQLIDALIAANQEIDTARTTRATDTTSAVTS